MRAYWVNLGLKSNDMYPYKRQRREYTVSRLRGDEGRDWSDAVTHPPRKVCLSVLLAQCWN